MRHSRAALIVPTLAAVAWHVRAALAAGPEGVRLAAIALGALAIGLGVLPQARQALGRVVAGLAGALCFWLAVLGLWAEHDTVLALGMLGVLAATSIHATILAVVLRSPTGETAAGRRAVQVGLALSTCALLVFGIEAACRLLMPLHFYQVVPDDPAHGSFYMKRRGLTVLRPGFRGQYLHPEFPGTRVEINGWGLRDDPEEATPPAPNALSILVLGDSFAFGTGVEMEETFQELLEDSASQITARPLRVYGAGVPGYAPFQCRRLLHQLAPDVQPDVVVACLFEGNDFQDNLASGKVSAEFRTAARSEHRAQAASTTNLARLLAGAAGIRFWAGSSALFQATGLGATLLSLGLAGPGAPSNLFFEYGLQVPIPKVAQRIRAATIAEYGRIQAACATLGAHLLVLMIPAVIQADPRRFETFEQSQPHDTRQLSRTAFHASAVAALRAAGIQVLDPLPMLEAESRAGRPCYHREGHWNAHGHEIAAQALIPVLHELVAARNR